MEYKKIFRILAVTVMALLLCAGAANAKRGQSPFNAPFNAEEEGSPREEDSGSDGEAEAKEPEEPQPRTVDLMIFAGQSTWRKRGCSSGTGGGGRPWI